MTVKTRISRRYPWYKHVKWWIQDFSRALPRKIERLIRLYRGGYVCEDCGTLTRFKHPTYSGSVNGVRMLLESFSMTFPLGKSLCPHCLYDRIAHYWTIAARISHRDATLNSSSGVFNGACHWTNHKTEVIGGIRPFDNPKAGLAKLQYIIIGSEWWNGFDASLPAIQQLLTVTGTAQTECIEWKNNRTEYLDGRISGIPQPVSEIIQRSK